MSSGRVGDIAVVGLAGRFPGASHVDAFWQNVLNGVESIRELSDDEILAAGVPESLLRDLNYVKASGVLENADLFDASFFGFTPREAALIDPQHRVFLECAYEALESAGHDPASFPGNIGVYAGCGINTYLQTSVLRNAEAFDAAGPYQVMLASDKDFLATRVSYKLNLRGPSVAVQSACSTSLVAVHFACQALSIGECDMAIAGGVSILFPQTAGYLYKAGMILSPDGHCRPFDARAQGTVPGRGAALVVLRRLEDAVADGNTIHAVIKGTAINNDGSDKVGYSAPSVAGQAQVIAAAQLKAAFDPDTIGYVEAHGTGTELGDPVELAALTQAFRARTERRQFCAIGSVKSNIGHLDAAAGAAGLIKCILAVRDAIIPPSLHFSEPNPHARLPESAFWVCSSKQHWAATGPRRAGVSSFGIGGTNAHVCLEESPTRVSAESPRVHQLAVLSAKSLGALATARRRLGEFVASNPHVSLADLTYTLQVGRRAFPYRFAAVCSRSADLVELDAESRLGKGIHGTAQLEGAEVAFIFAGQGSQYPGMGHEIYLQEKLFRREIDACCEILKALIGFDLRSILYPNKGTQDVAEAQIDQTEIAQVALFVSQYAAARFWMAAGIRPAAFLGHSIGEYTAACVSGVFSLEDALRVVTARGRVMQRAPVGAMLAVALPETEVARQCGLDLWISVLNGSSSTVVSGTTAAIESLESKLKQAGVRCARLRTSHAFHCPLVEPVLKEFEQTIASVRRYAPSIPFLSNVSGDWITASQATDPGYWSRHMRSPVRFGDGLTQLLKRCDVVIEAGPSGGVISSARTQPEYSKKCFVVSFRHRNERADGPPNYLQALGRLWSDGAAVKWRNLYQEEHRQRISLPTYPFERLRHWIEPADNPSEKAPPQIGPDRKGDLADWFYTPSWTQSFARSAIVGELTPGVWLLFEDDRGLAMRLRECLEKRGCIVINAQPGGRFQALGDGSYSVVPRSAEDLERIIGVATAQGRPLAGVAYLWSLSERVPGSKNASEVDSAEAVLSGGIALMRALGRCRLPRSVQFEILTDRLCNLGADSVQHPERAVVFGLQTAAPAEYPYLHCRAIDLDLGTPFETSVPCVVDELLSGPARETVAYRNRRRWVKGWQPVRLPPANPEGGLIRPGGCYLITGGLGGLGLMLGAHLVRRYNVKLILVSRSGQLPDPGPSESGGSLLARRAALDDIRRGCPEVLLVALDAADRPGLGELLKTARARWGRIDGVFHAAGSDVSRLVDSITDAEVSAVLHAKVSGTLALVDVLQNAPPDFLLLFSSLSTVVPAVGLSAYGGANAALDAFAQALDRTAGYRVIAVNWGPWLKVGMAVEVFNRIHGHAQSAQAQFGIEPQEGCEATDRILAAGPTQIAVFPNLLERMGSEGLSALEPTAPPSDPGTGDKCLSNAASRAPQAKDEIEQGVIEIWRHLLGLVEIGPASNFFELGGHSLLATEVLVRIRSRFGVQLPLRVIFEATTPASLAELIRITGSTSAATGATDSAGETETIEI